METMFQIFTRQPKGVVVFIESSIDIIIIIIIVCHVMGRSVNQQRSGCGGIIHVITGR